MLDDHPAIVFERIDHFGQLYTFEFVAKRATILIAVMLNLVHLYMY